MADRFQAGSSADATAGAQAAQPAGYDQTYFSHFEANPHELSFLAVHDFRILHMKNIYYYQMELLQSYPQNEIDGKNIQKFRELLAGYTQAVQNYEYMLHLPRPSSRKVRGQRECLEHLSPKEEMSRNDHRIIRGEAVGFIARLFYYDPAEAAEGWFLTLKGRIQILFRDLSWRDIISRTIVGTFVGAPFLLGPMILLQFRDTRTWKLVTVCVAVVLFSLFLGLATASSNADHLMAVAAYAAVMVVFVGTSTPTCDCTPT